MTPDMRNAVMKQYICVFAVAWLMGSVRVCKAEHTIQLKTAEMTSVGSVLTKIPQELKWPSTQRKEYKVLNGQEFTEVTKYTGVLKVRKEMDRETLCIDNRDHCIVEIQVAAWPVNRRRTVQMVNIEIEVMDINDNAPRFENTIIHKSMSEAVRVGTSIRLDSAVDPDLGVNSIQDYRLISKGGPNTIDNYFELGTIINIDGSKIPELTLKRSLDRETKGLHTLVLEAFDGGTPALTGTATVLINITDSNDNIPKFDQTLYEVKVDEHEATGTTVIKVLATDEDTGDNGKIIYKFPSVVGERERGIFALDPNSGVISVKNSTMLDYETKKIHHLSVEATDLGPNAVSAYATVTIHVQDVNDNKPEFAVTFMQNKFIKKPPKSSDYDEIIMEDINPEEYIAFVTITDQDAGANGTVTCNLQDNDAFILESIDEANARFVLKTKREKKLDREMTDSYELTLEAADRGDPPQANSRTLFLKVGDINDNAPEFSYNELAVKVSETARKGAVVMTLKATDKDEKPGPNSNITYSFLRRSDHIVKDGRSIMLTDIFEVNPATGDVMLAIPDVLDAETERTPGYLKVLAKDNGWPSLNTTTKLQITVVDENDNAPKFKNQSYVFRVEEHTGIGQFIGQVEATDADYSKDTNGKVTYSMEKFGSPDSKTTEEDQDLWLKMFQVKAIEGAIHFYGNSSKLDREVYGDRPIQLLVVATDNGFKRHRAEAKIEIYLNDINDNEPLVLHPNGREDVGFVQIISEGSRQSDMAPFALKFRSPQKWASIVTVREGSNATGNGISSVSLSHVNATDKDLGLNSVLSYAIVDANPDNHFDVDAKKGNVTFSSDVDINSIKLGCQILKIRVSDFGNPVRHSYAYVNLYLSRKEVGMVNATNAMLQCQKNPLFPKLVDGSAEQTQIAGMTLYLIIGFAALIFIILLVIIIVLIKCCCCAKRKKSKTYNCQEGSPWNASSGYDVDSKRNIRKRGSSKRSYNGHGTVDSRSSFHSEWTASQSQLPPDKMAKVRVLPDVQSHGSAESPNAHDSGTGDSVSGEAYHHNNYSDMMNGQNYLPTNEAQYMQRNTMPMKYSAHTDHTIPYGADPNLYGTTMISPKCTSDCFEFGHGDHCWMPDSLLRGQPQGQIDIMPGGHPDLVTYKFHQLSSPALRYQGDPNTNTPYYYDPGKKFSHSTEGSDHMSYGKGLDDMYRQPMDTLTHHASYGRMHAPSPHPLQQRMYPSDAERERAYINLQGYDPPSQPEEMHSNLSSTSSNNNQFGAGLPQNHPRLANHPQMFYQVPAMQNPRYEAMYRPGMHETGSMPIMYTEDYSASNLLPTASDIPPDYNHHWEQGLSMEQQPLINRSEFIPSRSGRTSNPVFDDRLKMLPLQAEGLPDHHREADTDNQQLIPNDEKLTTIQESDPDRREV